MAGALSRLAWWATAAGLFLVGWHYRFRDLAEQVLGGDEYHAVRVARKVDLLSAFTYYEQAENSIPFTLWARALMDTVGFTEWRFRLPVFVAGSILALFPLLLYRRLGRGATLVALGFMATTPHAIYYSFTGRPYGPAALLLAVAVLSWLRWMERRSRLALATYVVTGTSAVFFHLLCLLPIGWLTVLSFVMVRRGRIPLRDVLIGKALLLVAGMAVFLPGISGLLKYRLLESTRPDVGSLSMAWEAVASLVGIQPSFTLAVLALAVVGAVRLVRKDLMAGLALAGIMPAVLLGMFVTQAYPSVTAWTRYLFLAHWSLVLLASFGLVGLAGWMVERLRTRPVTAGLVAVFGLYALSVWWRSSRGIEGTTQAVFPWLVGAAALGSGASALLGRAVRQPASIDLPLLPVILAMLVCLGQVLWVPMPLYLNGPDSFRTRRASVKRIEGASMKTWRDDMHPVFHALADDPDSGDLLLLWPYRVMTALWRPATLQQLVHRKRVVMVHERTLKTDRGMNIHFENIIDLGDVEDAADEHTRYFVLDLDFIARAEGEPSAPSFTKYVDPQAMRNAGVKRAYYEHLQPILARRHGEPVFADERLVVYDLWADRDDKPVSVLAGLRDNSRADPERTGAKDSR